MIKIQYTFDEICDYLLETCRKLMENDELDRNDDFFSMGGNSVVAVGLLEAIYSRYHVELQIYDIVGSPTIEEWADLIMDQLEK